MKYKPLFPLLIKHDNSSGEVVVEGGWSGETTGCACVAPVGHSRNDSRNRTNRDFFFGTIYEIEIRRKNRRFGVATGIICPERDKIFESKVEFAGNELPATFGSGPGNVPGLFSLSCHNVPKQGIAQKKYPTGTNIVIK